MICLDTTHTHTKEKEEEKEGGEEEKEEEVTKKDSSEVNEFHLQMNLADFRILF